MATRNSTNNKANAGRKHKPTEISMTDFRATIKEVFDTREEVIITHRGKPIFRVVPIDG